MENKPVEFTTNKLPAMVFRLLSDKKTIQFYENTLTIQDAYDVCSLFVDYVKDHKLLKQEPK